MLVGGLDVTRDVRGLRFSAAALGGFEGLSCRINRPPESVEAIAGQTPVVLVDERSSQIVWSGFVAEPGDQEVNARSLDLTAVGLRVLAERRTSPLLYIDRDYSNWEQVTTSVTTSVQIGAKPTDTDPDATPGITMKINPGQPIGTGAGAVMFSTLAYLFRFAGVYFDEVGGSTGGYQGEVRWYPVGGGSGVTSIIPWNTTPTAYARYVGSPWTELARTVHVVLTRTGAATNITTDDIWWHLQPVVRGEILHRDGSQNLPTSAAEVQSITSTEVVADLLGRGLLPGVDAASSVIVETTELIESLVWMDDVTPAQVLDTLAAREGRLWRITVPHGTPRLEWVDWPTTSVRYVIDDRDSYIRRGQAQLPANHISVRWNDAAGRPRRTVVSTVVPGVDGIVYAEPVTLSGAATVDEAIRLGEETLADLSNQPDSGTAAIGRPLFDHERQRWVQPWEITPGCLVQIARTGAVVRLTDCEWDDDAHTMTLTLGNPARSAEDRLAAVLGSGRG